MNYDEVLNDGKTEKEISKEEMTSRENKVVTGFEIVPYRGGSVFSPCKSIVPYESKSDLMNFLNNHHIPLKPPLPIVPPPPIVPSNKYLRTLNESTVKIEEVPMDPTVKNQWTRILFTDIDWIIHIRDSKKRSRRLKLERFFFKF